MSPVESYSTTAASNNAAPPDGFPEGQTPASLNDSARQVLADLATLVRQFPWIKLTTGLTLVRNSNTQFQITGIDVTSIFYAGRPLREIGATTVFGLVSTSSFSAGNTLVNVINISGAAIPASLTSVDVSCTGDATGISYGTIAIAASQTVSGTFADARIASSSGAMPLIGAVATASAVSGLDLNSRISSSFDYYEILFNFRFNTDNTPLFMRTSVDNGANFSAGGSDYQDTICSLKSSDSAITFGGSTTAFITLTGLNGVGNATNEGISGRVFIDFLGSATLYPQISWEAQYLDGSTRLCKVWGSGARNSAAAINSVQLICAGGVTFTGSAAMYGKRKS